MSAPNPQPVPAVASGKPKSSPVGRILIGVLLVVLAFEAVPYARMSLAHSKLLAELKKAEAGDHKVNAEAVKQLLGGREPDLSKTKRVAAGDELYQVYYFNGLLKRRELCAHFSVQGEDDPNGRQRELMEVTTIIPEEILVDDDPPARSTPAQRQPEATSSETTAAEQTTTSPAAEQGGGVGVNAPVSAQDEGSNSEKPSQPPASDPPAP